MSSCSPFDSDLAAIFADDSATVSVVFGDAPTEQSANGIFTSEDAPEPDGQGGIVIVSRKVVVIQDGSITGLEDDASIVVDGTTYTIHGVRSGGRGRTRVILA